MIFKIFYNIKYIITLYYFKVEKYFSIFFKFIYQNFLLMLYFDFNYCIFIFKLFIKDKFLYNIFKILFLIIYIYYYSLYKKF